MPKNLKIKNSTVPSYIHNLTQYQTRVHENIFRQIITFLPSISLKIQLVSLTIYIAQKVCQ